MIDNNGIIEEAKKWNELSEKDKKKELKPIIKKLKENGWI